MMKDNEMSNEIIEKVELFKTSKQELSIEKLRELARIFEEHNNERMMFNVMSYLVTRDDCVTEDKIHFRKSVYKSIVLGKTLLDENGRQIIENVLTHCPVDNEKLNIGFIKKLIKSLKSEPNPNHRKILECLELYNSDLLNRTPFNDGDYSDYDLYVIDIMKCYNNLDMYEEAEEFYSNIDKNEINDLGLFHLKYNLCKFRYQKSNFKCANELYSEIALLDRKDYVLILPIKFKDETNLEQVYCNILELLSVGISKEKGFYLKYIYDWIEKKDIDLFDSIKAFVEIKENKHINVTQYYKFRKVIVEYYLEKIKGITIKGKLINLTKSGNGFVKDEKGNSYFVNKKYIRKVKLNSKLVFITQLSYNKIKNEENLIGIVLKEMK